MLPVGSLPVACVVAVETNPLCAALVPTEAVEGCRAFVEDAAGVAPDCFPVESGPANAVVKLRSSLATLFRGSSGS
jgi:hypothetical protein